MPVQLLFPNTSGAAFRSLSPGRAPQQPDTAHPVRSSFSEHICRRSTALGTVPRLRRRAKHTQPGCSRGAGGGCAPLCCICRLLQEIRGTGSESQRRGGKERVEGSSGDKIFPSPDRARATPPLEKKKKKIPNPKNNDPPAATW